MTPSAAGWWSTRAMNRYDLLHEAPFCRLARDEIECAVMRATDSTFAQILVNRPGEATVREKEHFGPSADFGFAEELGRSGWGWGSHVDRFCHQD